MNTYEPNNYDEQMPAPEMPEGMQDYSQPTQPVDEPTVQTVASEYDQVEVMGMVLDTIEDFVADEFPEETGEDFDKRCHGVMSDLVANSLSAVIYNQDAELLDAILKKAVVQAAERWQRDEQVDAQFKELIRALDAGEVGFVSHTPGVN